MLGHTTIGFDERKTKMTESSFSDCNRPFLFMTTKFHGLHHDEKIRGISAIF
jgi:hypothetical protein